MFVIARKRRRRKENERAQGEKASKKKEATPCAVDGPQVVAPSKVVGKDKRVRALAAVRLVYDPLFNLRLVPGGKRKRGGRRLGTRKKKQREHRRMRAASALEDGAPLHKAEDRDTDGDAEGHGAAQQEADKLEHWRSGEGRGVEVRMAWHRGRAARTHGKHARARAGNRCEEEQRRTCHVNVVRVEGARAAAHLCLHEEAVEEDADNNCAVCAAWREGREHGKMSGGRTDT